MTTKRFTSPINWDDGERHQFIGHARSELRFELHQSGLAGTLHWDFEFIDGRHKGVTEHREIRLFFDRHKRLIDFAGTFELPDEAIELLEQQGYNCQYAKN